MEILETNISSPKLKRRAKTEQIIWHCTASKEGMDFKAADIDRWHRSQGWSCCGYHYVIDLDGTIEAARPEWAVGSHVSNHNYNTIGVVYVGGLDQNLRPKDTRTPAQKQSLLELTLYLMSKYNIKLKDVLPHHYYNKGKACPCITREQIQKELQEYIENNQP